MSLDDLDGLVAELAMEYVSLDEFPNVKDTGGTTANCPTSDDCPGSSGNNR